jgi:hypothetical protein
LNVSSVPKSSSFFCMDIAPRAGLMKPSVFC